MNYFRKAVFNNFSSLEKGEGVFLGIIYVFLFINYIPAGLFSKHSTSELWFSFFQFEFILFLLFLTFLILNFKIIPQLLNKVNVYRNTLILIAVLMAFYASFKDLDAPITVFFVLVVYNSLKYSAVYLWNRYILKKINNDILGPGSFYVLILWFILILLLISNSVNSEVISIFSTIIPFSVLIYSISFYNLIPRATKNSKPLVSYFLKLFKTLAIFVLPIILFTMFFEVKIEVVAIALILNVLLQICVTAPISWWIYDRHKKSNDELLNLKKDLGQSTANLDFLKSQINPHFLFNALNTLYSTALQENSDRTSEGIQKLGDIMRFMLYDNFQNKISLKKELDYLRNYIEFQKLRTEINPDIQIKLDLKEPAEPLQIAPMLLIPFVENAFKHGISLMESSVIRISLDVRFRNLIFIVYNTVHRAKKFKVEKEKGGIGLANVKERLNLFYPEKHDLIIREEEKDFYVELKIDFNK